tara:strand:+ start:1820 stop:2290 length:471 start_codon:yes stop_codon:yes gene_type:complete
VQETLKLCKDAELLKPINWIDNVYLLPSEIPSSLHRFGLLKEGALHDSYGEWQKYLRAIRDMSSSIQLCQDEKDIKQLKDKFTTDVFWGESSKLPALKKIAGALFAYCPSGAEVERSFKKLRMILPSDHQRDVMKEKMLAMEMFASFNNRHLALFQ